VLAGTALVATAPAAFSQTTSPGAFGIEATGALGVGPTPNPTLTTPNPAPVASLTVADLGVTALTASVTSNSATASVASLTSGTGGLLGVVTAGIVSSSCLANADGSLVRTASIAGLTIGGISPPAGPIAPNTVLVTIPAIGTVTLNQQVTGPITGSEEVNAIRIVLLGGTEVVNIASSTCGPFTADTPVASGKGGPGSAAV
jgi:hypothetical protein